MKGTFTARDTLQKIGELKPEVNLYVGGMTIGSQYRTSVGNFKILVNAFFDYLFSLVKQKIVIKHVITRGVTGDGKKLCLGMGMKYVISNEEHGMVFQADFETVSKTQQPLIQYLAGMKNDRV
jgi:hypothetical protein